jgi:hypothetical protein
VTGLGTTSGTTAGGTSVAITGTNFTGATGVFFGGVAATSFTVNSATSITATSPADYAGTYDVTVATYAGTSAPSAGDQFTDTLATTPAVTGLGTTTGPTGGGTSVAITGNYFTGATAVLFGNVAATSFTVNSDTSITATSPPQAAGTVDVTVTTYAGTSAAVSADQFIYTSVVPAVTSLGTTSGSTGGGTAVTINGSGFTGATGVTFGNLAAAFTVVSDTQISAVSPPQAMGPVDVRVTAYGGTSAVVSGDQFTYNNAATPAVTGVTPNSGSTVGGTVVTVSGSGFTGATSVQFQSASGSVAALSYTVLSDSTLLVTAPPGAAGTVDITVTSYAGTSATGSADHFTYNAASAPTITSLNPSTGSTAGGTFVTITGTGFLGATGVSFGGTPAASFAILSDTTILATTPPLPAETVDVTVSAYGLTSALNGSDRFVVTAVSAPAVTGLTGSPGTTAGGTTVTVTGTGFTGASAVLFGSVAAAGFTVNSDTSITAVSPPQGTGTVDVIVVTPTGTSAVSSSDHFTYNSGTAPTVTGLSQTGGGTGGGTVVTITGSNFTGVTAVNFGTVAAGFTFVSDGCLIATSPPQAPAINPVDVTVMTTSGTSATSSADKFTYTTVVPTVTSVTPNTGTVAGGITVTVVGSNFTGATAVNFGTTAATSFTVLADNALTAVVPAAAATGTVDVTVVAPGGTSATGSADQFTYTAGSAPTVTGISPGSGSQSGGTIVIVAGTNFTGATGVSFGSYGATSFFVNSPTQITAVAPAQGATTVDITVTTPIGTSATSSADQFTYNAASNPTVTAVSPSSGPTSGGTSVIITGTNLAGATTVKFGSLAAQSFTFNPDGTISAVSPAEVAGTVDITVTTVVGTSGTGTADQFTFATDAGLSGLPGGPPPDGQPAIGPTVNVSFTGTVAQFIDGDTSGAASQFTAYINWGNGQYSVGQVQANGFYGTLPMFKVVGSGGLYTATGSYTMTVLVLDVGGATRQLSVPVNVGSGGGASVRPGPAATGTKATATHGVAFKGNVASFTGTGHPASYYTATIDWGNNKTTAGTIVATGTNTFNVVGTQTYMKPGTYTVKITITDGSGASTTVTTTIIVADAQAVEPDEDDEWVVPDDPSRPADQTTVIVRVDQTTPEDDPPTMPSDDAMPDEDGWDEDVIVAAPLGELKDPLGEGMQQARPAVEEVQEDDYATVIVTDTATASQAVVDYARWQDNTVVVEEDAAAVAWRLAGNTNWSERLQCNDAIFGGLADKEATETSYNNGLVNGHWDDAPASSLWEDFTNSVRSIFDDMTASV